MPDLINRGADRTLGCCDCNWLTLHLNHQQIAGGAKIIKTIIEDHRGSHADGITVAWGRIF